MTATQVPTADKIRVLQRELELRRAVYPQRVADGKMTQRAADYQIEVLESILDDYQRKDRLRPDAERTP